MTAGDKLRLAFFTPLNPRASGISDYSEELLPYLAEHADVDLVVDDYQPSSPDVVQRFRVIRVDEFLRTHRTYDSVIYQIGNNFHYHGYMVGCLRAVPGIVVVHDCSLSYLILGLTVMQGDFGSLKRILGSERPGTLALRQLLSFVDPYEVSLCRPIVEMSQGVIVHNDYARRKLASEFPDRTIRVIHHATPIREIPQTDPLRRRYGFASEDFLLTSISSVAYNKRLYLVLRALPELRNKFPQIKFVMVGQGQLGSDLRTLIHELGLSDIVTQTGFVSAEQYLDYIAMADLIIDLRYPSTGETSGSSLRALQAGKAMVVSAQGFFLELPDTCCVKIPVNADEQQGVIDTVTSLIGDPERRRRMGTAARDFAVTHLRREDAASSYIEFIRHVIASPDRPITPEGFPTSGKRSVSRVFVASIYKFFRLGYLFRHYGVGDTLTRIRQELHLRR